MGQAIGDMLPAAVGVAISPLPIVAVVLTLVSARGRVNGPGRSWDDPAAHRCRRRRDRADGIAGGEQAIALPAFRPYKGNLPKKVAVGMISHRRLQVETPEDIAADIRTALEHVDADKLVFSSDCDFG